jgi:hypothetical protein
MCFISSGDVNAQGVPRNTGEIPIPQCPQSLPIVQYAQTHVEEGWKLVNNNKTRSLANIGISYEEYPAVQSGFNIPFAEKKQPNGNSISYYEIGPVTSEYPGYWVTCLYAESAVVVVRKLPQAVRHCEVTYINDALAPSRVTFKCFDTSLEGNQK